MASAVRKPDRLNIIPRDKSMVAQAHPVEGDHEQQISAAFAKTFRRYEKALEELSKI